MHSLVVFGEKRVIKGMVHNTDEHQLTFSYVHACFILSLFKISPMALEKIMDIIQKMEKIIWYKKISAFCQGDNNDLLLIVHFNNHIVVCLKELASKLYWFGNKYATHIARYHLLPNKIELLWITLHNMQITFKHFNRKTECY